MSAVKKRIQKPSLKSRLYFKVSERDEIKAAVQFSIMLIASALMGVVFAKYFISGIFVARNSSIAAKYFSGILPSLSFSFKTLAAIINNSLIELASVFIITLSAFGRFNYLVSDVILIMRGFCDGFLVMFLYRCVKNEFLKPNITVVNFTVYFLSKIILLLLLYAFTKRISACSISIKRSGSAGLQGLKIKSGLYAVLLAFREIFTIILINSISCTIIFLMK